MLYTHFPEIVLLSACLSFFRTVFSSVIYRFDYNILFSASQGFLLDQIRHIMQNGTGPARKVSHKHTDRYPRLPETVPMVFPRLLRQTVWASAQGSAEKEAAENTVPARPGSYRSHRLSTVRITCKDQRKYQETNSSQNTLLPEDPDGFPTYHHSRKPEGPGSEDIP